MNAARKRQTAAPMLSAARTIVSVPPGQPTTLTLYYRDGALGSIVLGPADAVALASDLLLTARARLGRLLECPAIESWRALVSPGALSAGEQRKQARANQRLSGAVLEASSS
jgi:hypothetical protein